MNTGDRIEMTKLAISQSLHGTKNRRTGFFVRRSRKYPGCIIVRRDGSKQRERYSEEFWQPAQFRP